MPLDDNPGRRPSHRHRDLGARTCRRDIPKRAGLRRLTPLQRSTGGKQRLGATSKMGERTIQRLLILGGSAVVRHACTQGAPVGSWLSGMLARKPRMLVTVALANKTARIVWALLVKGEACEAPGAAA